MKIIPLLSCLALCFSLSHCVVVDDSSAQTEAGTSYGQPLTAVKGPGSVTIMEGSSRVSTLQTASPNVEQTRFISEQEQIVVKSRGNHGPATVQLFNSRSGRLEGTVMAYEIKNNQPSWAAGMGE